MKAVDSECDLRKYFLSLLLVLIFVVIILLFVNKLAAGLLILFATHLLLLFAQLNPSVQWLGPVVTSFKTDKNEVWLTIDDGPDADETLLILDLLDEYHAKATFFVIGSRAKADPEIVREIVKRGHQVANHTMNHPERSFWSLSQRRLEKEIADCSELIAEINGQKPVLFRAPVGHKPWSLHPILQRAGLPLIAWTARGYDGLSTDSEGIVRRIQKQLRPGAIILLHEGRGTLVASLGELLPDLSKRDYRCILPEPKSFVRGRR